MQRNLFPHHLFGNYIIEIAKLFKISFRNFQLSEQTAVTPLQVYYGTPRAAFRHWYERFNGQLLLPALNFNGADYRRRFDKECPNVHLEMSDPRSFDPVTRTVAVQEPPMHFDVTYSFNIFNNSLRERDRLLHYIFQMFPRGQSSIRWFPDPVNYSDIFLFMPLSIEETFTDETEVEGLDKKETRDIIRTSFNIISSAVVPYNIKRVPAILKFYIENDLVDKTDEYFSITINQILEGNVYWHTYYTSGSILRLRSNCDYSFNGIWHYLHSNTVYLNAKGSATII